MLHKNRFYFLSLPKSLSFIFPYITLLLWILPLLLFSSETNSLMAHDEGLYASRARQMFDSGDWIHPWENAHHKTPGFYWAIATLYSIFGVNETSVRLPSMILGILSTLVLYEIGKIILNQRIAWLAAAILNVQFLWLQYCRLGTPDVTMIFLTLLSLWSLLQGELNTKYRNLWIFMAGISWGLGFLIRGFMIILPIVALLPYLLAKHRQHRHLFNPSLYLGLIISLIPSLLWIWQSFLYYGSDGFQELFKFIWRLSSEERNNNHIFFYFWNVPIKSFPWSCLSILGFILTIRNSTIFYKSILVGFPVTLLIEISIFPTRLPHYSLSLYPFTAFLAAIALDWLARQMKQKTNSKLLNTLSYFLGIIGILLLLTAFILNFIGDHNLLSYINIAITIGSGWLILLLVWINRHNWGNISMTTNYWITCWLITPWLALALAGSNGLMGDYNPEVKGFFQQPEIQNLLDNNQVHFVDVGGKTGVLLNFYTPKSGKKLKEATKLSTDSYTWISKEKEDNLSIPYLVLGEVKDYRLIKLLSLD